MEPTQEFSFGRIYSAGGSVDIGVALGIDSEFSLLSPNDDWEVEAEDVVEKGADEDDSSDGEDAELRATKEAEGRQPAAGKKNAAGEWDATGVETPVGKGTVAGGSSAGFVNAVM